MNFIRIKNIRNAFRHLKSEGVSMRRRFVVYIVSAVALVVSLILLLLNVFGVLNPTNAQMAELLDTQLASYSSDIEHDYDRIAAYAISFSHQLEAEIQKYLTAHNISFEDLKNNPEALLSLQNQLYDAVYLNMQLAPASGAFYILDSTVNSRSPDPLYNGIYLKYVNLYSENTINNSITLYRGSFVTGRDHELTFHSGWQNEMRTDFFDQYDSVFTKGTHYVLSPTVEIPDTWERSRYVYVPIRNMKDQVIGVCGFEVNDLYFQLSKNASSSKLGPLVGALLDNEQGDLTGQFNSNRYKSGFISVSSKNSFTEFDFGEEKCIGKTKSIKLGKDTFTVALMLPEAQFDDYINRGQIKVACIILFVVAFALAYCLFISKKYVSPVLKKFEQIKANKTDNTRLKIQEIDNLVTFLAEKSAGYEDRLKELEAANLQAEEEAQRTREAYAKALEEYQLAQHEIRQLSDGRKKEIVLEDYEYFVCSLKTLTPTEYRIYELYAQGKTAVEITEIMGIKENTMKFHNKNIYGKLGVSSRKELLKFAALKQHQDKKTTQPHNP